MGETTAITWTDHTFNPWWGCERVSPGCSRCYAEALAKRWGHDVWGKKADRRFFGDKHWNEPLGWAAKADAEGVRRRVFCASMADVFEDRPELVEHRQRLFDLIAITEPLDWLLLTKRPENVARMVEPECWGQGLPWPANIWLGTTVEDQERADLRIPELLTIPARVRFLSCEPLLGPVDLGLLDHRGHESDDVHGFPHSRVCLTCSTEDHDVEWFVREPTPIDWVIVGGESGPKFRALNLDHVRSLRDQCVGAGVPFFFKQVGGRTNKAGGDLLDGVAYKEFPASVVAA